MLIVFVEKAAQDCNKAILEHAITSDSTHPNISYEIMYPNY